MTRLSITAVSLSLTVLAGCSTPGDQVATTATGPVAVPQPVTATKSDTLRPALTAPVEVVKRNKADPNRKIRVSGDHAA